MDVPVASKTNESCEALRVGLGNELLDKVREAKVLVVGAGGIGCELLKNLALSGFTDIETIDLDTIDVSNLNRQFLFRKKHVGKSKANIAREAVLGFNPHVSIKSYHANVYEERFNVPFFKRFTIVMNALDNLGARKHVNRLCLAANVPLIEAGSTGHLGQVSVIKKDVTECYECTPKPTPKTYALCTLRSTPSKPVHTITWAKELHKLLFGDAKESILWEADEKESAYITTVSKRPIDASADAMKAYARNVFVAIFGDEIVKKIDMGKYKGAKKKPKPLNLNELLGGNRTNDDDGSISFEDRQSSFAEQQKVWSAGTCAELFLRCVEAMFSSRSSDVGSAIWDKDDRLDLCFVTCASNLRAVVFDIPCQSSFKVKEIAGNIISAIATTNAMVAGLQVLEAFKILRAKDASEPDAELKRCCKTVWVNMQSKSRKGHLLMPSRLESPSEKCFVCRNRQLTLRIDTDRTRFSHLIKAVLKKKLAFNTPTVSTHTGSTVWEEGEDADDFSENLDKVLSALGGGGIKNGRVITVEDFSQDNEVNILIVHVDEDTFDEKKNPMKFVISGDDDAMTTSAATKNSENDAPKNGESKKRLSQKRKDRSESHEETVMLDITSTDTKKVRIETTTAEKGEAAEDDGDVIILLD